MATGSVSAALKDPSVADSFRIVRKANPDGFLLANIGAGSPIENAQRAVELFGADALQIHLNAPQELVMPEGDRQFSQWLSLLEKTMASVAVPVVVKRSALGCPVKRSSSYWRLAYKRLMLLAAAAQVLRKSKMRVEKNVNWRI